MLKPYSAFSREAGPQEGAILVIAHTSAEAKKLAWRSGGVWNIDSWVELAIHLIRDNDVMMLADQNKVGLDQAHVIDQPATCENCNMWGAGIDVDKLCNNCNEQPGDVLVKLLTS